MDAIRKVSEQCPHCEKAASGDPTVSKARIRPDTGEHVHDLRSGSRIGQTLCLNDPKWKAKNEKSKTS